MAFIFAGYELREMFAPSLPVFKCPDSCVTMDSSLCELHPKAADRAWEMVNGETNSTTLRFNLGLLDQIYRSLSFDEQLRYCIYGYSVEAERGPLLETNEVDLKGETTRVPLFAYAKMSTVEISTGFILLGYDVVDVSCEWLSAVSNCGQSCEESETFGPLNRFNLYESEANARAFRCYADESIPEHAPFSVWQVWAQRASFDKSPIGD